MACLLLLAVVVAGVMLEHALLGGTETSQTEDDLDLFQLGGCLLRAVLQPRRAVLARLQAALDASGLQAADEWVGVHYRSFAIGVTSQNVQMTTKDAHQGDTGTTEAQMAACAFEAWRTPINGSVANRGVRIVSDSSDSSRLIAEGLGGYARVNAAAGPALVSLSGQACHIDKTDDEAALQECLLSTATDWLWMSFASVLVTKGGSPFAAWEKRFGGESCRIEPGALPHHWQIG